jgi:hypothetical protein
MPHPNVETLRRIDQAQVAGTWRRPFRSTPTMSWGMWAATTS